MLGCHRCGYSIEQPRVGAVCPECALPVEASLAAAAQPLAQPRFRRRFVPGALLLAGALVLYAVEDVVRMLVTMWQFPAPTAGALRASWWLSNVSKVVGVPLLCVFVLGVWLATTRPRGVTGGAWPSAATRTILGAWVLVALLPTSAYMLAGITGWGPQPGTPGWASLWQNWFMAMSLVHTLLLVCLCAHLAWLESLHGSAHLRRWLKLAVCVAVSLMAARLPPIALDVWLDNVIGRSSAVTLRHEMITWTAAALNLLLAWLCVQIARLVRRNPPTQVAAPIPADQLPRRTDTDSSTMPTAHSKATPP